MSSNDVHREGVRPSSNSEDEEIAADDQQAAIEQRLKEAPNHQHPIIILDGDEDEKNQENEERYRPEIAEIIDLTTDDVLKEEGPAKILRNLPVQAPDTVHELYLHNELLLKPQMTVEMRPIDGLYKSSFLAIQLIIQRGTEVVLRGIPLTRARNYASRLPRLCNEVCQILYVEADDDRDMEIQAAIEIPIENVVRVRRCHKTNTDFPCHRAPRDIYQTVTEIEEKAALMCRWRATHLFAGTAQREGNKPLELVLEHLQEQDITKSRFRVPDEKRMNQFRGGKMRGGSYDPLGPHAEVVVNVEESEETAKDAVEWVQKREGQKYTFADLFSGAGGVSYGAQKAGVHIKIACDNAPGACKTYRLVFPGAELFEMDIYDFIRDVDSQRVRVDILHLSPPCQFWSPAHTVEGVNDEANIAVLFSCHELVKKVKPRIFTLEQTFGILAERFQYYFNSLLHGFTRLGYSVRWRVVNLLDWGAPARRQRLILVGACPGEALPAIPGPRYAERPVPGDGTKPFISVRHMLDRIPAAAAGTDALHRPAAAPRRDQEPWDPTRPLARCITTNGGYGNYHFGGRRDFTQREYAVLQGFPPAYPFQHPHRKRQIGNAFPPPCVKVLYVALRRQLEAADRVFAGEDEPFDPDDVDILTIRDDPDEGKTDEEEEEEEAGKERRRRRRRRTLLIDENGVIIVDDDEEDDDDVVCTGSQPRLDGGGGGSATSPSSSARTISDTSSPDDMDVDTDDKDGEGVTVFCIDAMQEPVRRRPRRYAVPRRRSGAVFLS
ncbi:S-adenosyl-L-methionine-dependent methyltransferase [Xylariomycetidae sp. FL0641]|nr:S-adenosyl-L-methionine-dependent methyltransferase [Xylariomycetidae sp. FL0641]